METPDVSQGCRTLLVMAKSDSERGPFGTWLVKQRKARPGTGRDGSMTAAEVRAWLIRDQGFGIGESAYAELESGTALPSSEQRAHLASLFDSIPPQAHGSTDGTDIAALVARLERQAEVIDRLAAAVELLAKGQDAMLRGLLGGLAGLRQAPADDPTSPSPAGILR